MFTFRQILSSPVTNLRPFLMLYKKPCTALHALTVFAWFLSLGPMGSNSASAQATNEQVAAVRKNFDDCFYSSVAGQLKISRTTDYNMVSENAFRACSTKEQALAVLMTAYNVRSLLQWEDHIDFGKNLGQRRPLMNQKR